MLGLKETKKANLTNFDVVQLWGNDAVRWEFVGAEDVSGGLLLMWDETMGQSCSRIDRVLVSLEWLEEFPKTRLRGRPRRMSDHCPLFVDATRFMDKLKALTVSLDRRHRENFGNMHIRTTQFEEEIKKVDDMERNKMYDGTMEARIKALVSSYKHWYVRKELHWKQMSRSRHAKEMDKNTRYFHNLASTRRRNNQIDALMINGRLVRNQVRIKVAILDFYKDLYHQETSPNIGFRDGLVEQLSEEEAAELELMPYFEEINEAVWDCESTKALGNDGYNMNFIKKCWAEVGREFTEAVMDFFQSAMLPRDSNVTWVALAPKFVGAKEIKDFRPISMVGCVYKMISKVLVWRMRKVTYARFSRGDSECFCAGQENP
ncbi:uncharacterized protein LOC130932631 [Arachis stenosperma]|uniref:uncharacterized protein LOC130932631 n=1 Tax=Arachis stenosperma TaxID=217475 RepID=UPI0025AD321E|nr:uncharacterized protein LOC130932631 [Arachis stenosperma]